MFSLFSIEFLLLVVAAVLLLGGLSLLALRRRNEILRDYLTPKDHDLEQRMLKKRPSPRKKPAETASETAVDSKNVAPEDNVTWGTPG